MKDLIGLCCGCLMGVVVPLLFCRLAKHWNVLSDIAAGEILAYTSEVIPFCFCLFDFAYGLFNWLIFGSFRFLDIKIPTMALRVCAGGFLAILPAAALIVRVFPEVRSPEGVWRGLLRDGDSLPAGRRIHVYRCEWDPPWATRLGIIGETS